MSVPREIISFGSLDTGHGTMSLTTSSGSAASGALFRLIGSGFLDTGMISAVSTSGCPVTGHLPRPLSRPICRSPRPRWSAAPAARNLLMTRSGCQVIGSGKRNVISGRLATGRRVAQTGSGFHRGMSGRPAVGFLWEVIGTIPLTAVGWCLRLSAMCSPYIALQGIDSSRC